MRAPADHPPGIDGLRRLLGTWWEAADRCRVAVRAERIDPGGTLRP